MGWARFDDNYTTSSKILEAGYLAEILDMRGIIYCARNDTDGLVTPTAFRLLLRGLPPRAKREVDTLIAVGRWKTEPGGGWWIHDFLAYNPSKAQRDSQRERGRERVAKHRSNAVTNAYQSKGTGGDTRESKRVPEISWCERCGKSNFDCECPNLSAVPDSGVGA